MKLSVDNFSLANLSMSAVSGVAWLSRSGVSYFGSFLGHQPILLAELMVVLKDLDLIA